MSVLADLQNIRVFAIFEQIAAIPHGSGNTAALSRWCYNFGCDRGLKALQDDVGNVIIYKNGSSGREQEPPVILQAHLDMVCEKAAGKEFDFATQEIPVMTDGERIWADGTSLGADNGIGLAVILALLEDTALSHPPIEAVLTVDEETGLEGAANVDFSLLKGRRMINLDSEKEGIFTAGCAGGVRMEAVFPLSLVSNRAPAYEIQVKGLRGGHSGIEINKGRCNANRELAQWLTALQKQGEISLCAFSGGTVDNAIAAEAACVIATNFAYDQLQAKAKELTHALQTAGETEAVVTVEPTACETAFSSELTDRLLSFITSAPNGVQAMCKDLPELVETSLNIGVVRQSKTALSAVFALRSSVEGEKQALLTRLQTLAAQMGAATEVTGDYPGWEYRADSALQETMKQVYEQIYHTAPVVDVIHAGLECGLFCQKCPQLDAISIGPNMQNVHTPEEWVEVASVMRVYAFLTDLLEQL